MSFDLKIFAPNFPFSPKRMSFSYGWVIFFTYLCARAITVPGHSVGLCPFTEALIENLHIPRTHFSNILAVATLLSTLLLPLFGTIFDHIGIRRAITYSALMLGLTLLFMGHIVSAIASLKNYISSSTAVTGILFSGLFLLKLCGQNLIPLASRMMLLHWYDKKSCTALGISGVFISITFGCAPKIIHLLVKKLGYLNAWILLGFVTLLGFLPIIWALCRDNPKSIGINRNGSKDECNTVNIAEEESANISHDYTLRQALGTFDFWIFSLAAATSTFASTGLQIHIVDIFRETHACIADPFDIFPYIAIISAISGVLFSILQDRFSIRYCLLVIFSTNAAMMFFLENTFTSWGLWFFVFLCGFNWALYGIVYAAPWPKLFGKKYLGRIMSTAALIVSFFASIAPSALSYAKKDFGSYFILTRIFLFISVTCFVISTIHIKRKRALPS
ncbi:MAG: MFS transporter [Puniceicoccales bacterium]|jgi:MFS family permease|nr:MFS transporter [Puniceicoccales bacterium]